LKNFSKQDKILLLTLKRQFIIKQALYTKAMRKTRPAMAEQQRAAGW
jgi:hypothetical protein